MSIAGSLQRRNGLRRFVATHQDSFWQVFRQTLSGVLCFTVTLSVIGLDGCKSKQAEPEQTAANQQQQGQAPAATNAVPTADQLYQLVAPIALFPDNLLAQVLAASTYPDEVSAAYTWLQQNSNLQGQQLLEAANEQPWDPSVKGLTQFSGVLQQMATNLSWTSALGDAYFNYPQSVMNAVQVMRQRAQQSGNLKDTSQQSVTVQNQAPGAAAPPPPPPPQTEDASYAPPPPQQQPVIVQPPPQTIIIQPTQPDVVYVPTYNPTVVYGAPVPVYPGYSTGALVATSLISFGVGVAVGAAISGGGGCCGWGWNSWGCGWHSNTVVYNHNTYISTSNTFVNRNNYYANNVNVNNYNRNNVNVNNANVNNFNRNNVNANNYNRNNLNANNVNRNNLNNNNYRANNFQNGNYSTPHFNQKYDAQQYKNTNLQQNNRNNPSASQQPNFNQNRNQNPGENRNQSNFNQNRNQQSPGQNRTQPSFNQQNREPNVNQNRTQPNTTAQNRPNFNQNQSRTPTSNQNLRSDGSRGYGQADRGTNTGAFSNYGSGGNARTNSARGQQSLEGNRNAGGGNRNFSGGNRGGGGERGGFRK